MLNQSIKAFLLNEAKKRFLRYVKIDTRSDPESKKYPSSDGQWNLARMLKKELDQIGLIHVELDPYGYVYATLPASRSVSGPKITFCAHIDTSPSVSGTNVSPTIHKKYGGGLISFADEKNLTLSPEESPELLKFVGGNIITASGGTLLGADDKAGIAEIMASLAAFQKFRDLSHPELRIVFTPDEEIGKGTEKINREKLGDYGYTVDGGEIGELEDECFDAFEAELVFRGLNVHPGDAKNKMVNAGAIAARFVVALPEFETPERTEKKEGFFHLTAIKGDESLARIRILIRDFERKNNRKRIELLKKLIRVFELRYWGLRVETEIKDQYKNMKKILEKHPEAVRIAEQAIQMADVEVIRKAVRGGTDGSRLSFMGMPTPNIFAGGLMLHCEKEWIPEIALQKGAEVIVNICGLWAGGNLPRLDHRLN
ncbi:MAG TPA: peptidase T [Desulfobacterales bacterium]|nr:peptidase T [Desulfobacterales bacterium]